MSVRRKPIAGTILDFQEISIPNDWEEEVVRPKVDGSRKDGLILLHMCASDTTEALYSQQ